MQDSPFWRDRLPENIVSLEDYFERVPLLYRSDLMAAAGGFAPYGHVAIDNPALGSHHHSITRPVIGHPPVRSFEPRGTGPGPSTPMPRVLYAMGFGRSTAAWSPSATGFRRLWEMHYALERIGATPVPAGGMDSKARIKLLIDLQIEVLA